MLGLFNDIMFRGGSGVGGGTPAESKPLILQVITTTPSELVRIPSANGSSYDGTIQWEELGGAVLSSAAFNAYNDTALEYTFPDAGIYRCRISGIFGKLDCVNNNNSGTVESLYKLEQIGETQMQAYFGMLEDATSLVSAVWDVNDTVGIIDSVSSFNRIFQRCSGLTSVDLTGMIMPAYTGGGRAISNLFNGTAVPSIDFSGVDGFNEIGIFTSAAANNTNLTTITWPSSANFLKMVSMITFCMGSTSLTPASYDAFLNLAAAQIGNGLPASVSINWQDGGTGVNFTSAGATAHADLTTHGWSIADGGLI